MLQLKDIPTHLPRKEDQRKLWISDHADVLFEYPFNPRDFARALNSGSFLPLKSSASTRLSSSPSSSSSSSSSLRPDISSNSLSSGKRASTSDSSDRASSSSSASTSKLLISLSFSNAARSRILACTFLNSSTISLSRAPGVAVPRELWLEETEEKAPFSEGRVLVWVELGDRPSALPESPENGRYRPSGRPDPATKQSKLKISIPPVDMPLMKRSHS
ncbi:hypothetical protein STAS_00483 [Striga asiatica]|uniref:Uncharacterized protein n=1 Tax=Striga asiatica TaxID=4170 RepID=A0A5A7NWP7_STRAF|nr:hypothetical protein STAS_00483 [Striga asiatica]